MIIQKYLIITKTGSVSVRDREPRLIGSEMALHVSIDIPAAFFVRPILKATLKVPEESIPKSKLDVKVTDNIEKIIKDVTGLKMSITIDEHPEDKKMVPKA